MWRCRVTHAVHPCSGAVTLIQDSAKIPHPGFQYISTIHSIMCRYICQDSAKIGHPGFLSILTTNSTRIHSSRMRTARSSGRPGRVGGSPPGTPPGSRHPLKQTPPGTRHPSPPGPGIKPDTPINVYARFCLSTANSKISLVSPVADWWNIITSSWFDLFVNKSYCQRMILWNKVTLTLKVQFGQFGRKIPNLVPSLVSTG